MFFGRSKVTRAARLVAAGGAFLAGAAALFAADIPLGIPGTAATQPARLEPFGGLPPARPRSGAVRSFAVHPGTNGLALSPADDADHTAGGGGGVTIGVLGDLAPGDESLREKYLRMAISELNVLRPELVLSVGNMVPGMTRDGMTYARQADQLREMLEGAGGLKMPWYPCAGTSDVVSGVPGGAAADAAGGRDRRFEELYRRYIGPLYYSIDAGDVHAIVLDSEEGLGQGNTLSDGQLRWLANDLQHTFEGGAGLTRWVVVFVHRPLWRQETTGSNWQRVHDLLVAFNRRPVVTLEGPDSGGIAEARAPKVVGVFAGAERAYSMEPVQDGIHYYVLGPTAARCREGEDSTEALRHLTLVKFDRGDEGGAGGGGGMHLAIVELGVGGAGGGWARTSWGQSFRKTSLPRASATQSMPSPAGETT